MQIAQSMGKVVSIGYTNDEGERLSIERVTSPGNIKQIHHPLNNKQTRGYMNKERIVLKRV